MTKNDKKIKSLISIVESKKKNLGKKQRTPLLTNGIFHYDDEKYFNINTVLNIDKIVDALSFLIMKERFFKEASDILEVDLNFKWWGYSVSEWTEDFKSRIDFLKWNSDKKSLEETQKKLDSLISSEGKTSMEIDYIRSLLGDI